MRRRLVILAKRSQMCRVCICKIKGETGGRGGGERGEGGREWSETPAGRLGEAVPDVDDAFTCFLQLACPVLRLCE